MGISSANIKLPRLHVQVQKHIESALEYLPDDQHAPVLQQYNIIFDNEKRGEREANLFILHLKKHYQVMVSVPVYFFPAFLRVFSSLLHSDKSGKKLIRKMKLNKNIKGFWCANFDDNQLDGAAEGEAARCRRLLGEGLENLERGISYAVSRGVISVGGKGFEKEKAQFKRLVCSKWWGGQLRRIRTRASEAQAQLLGLVKDHISKSGYNYQQEKHERAIQILADNVAVSPDGKEVSLLDIAMTAIRGRFYRLLNWTDGMGEYADKYHHDCAMYTITCPSRMHPNSEKYDGTSTREAQQYLADLWNQANARFKKRKIYPYGVRVSEPHKDGAVHWHVLIFAPMDVLLEIDSILKDHALRVDGDEKGAGEHRYEFKLIIKKEGGAKPSSYLFKYLMKGLGGDAENWTAEDVDKIITEKLTSVRAWAKTHGIRQVQIVGAPSVGVWDTLRRMPNDKELSDPYLEAIRKACNDNNFCFFFELQGGHTVGKTHHYARPARQSIKTIEENVDVDTGEITIEVGELANEYGEVIEEVVGVKVDDDVFINHKPKWSIDWVNQKNDDELSLKTVDGFSVVPDSVLNAVCVDAVSLDVLMEYEASQGWS